MHSKILWLLARTCFLMVEAVMNNRTGFSGADFGDTQVVFKPQQAAKALQQQAFRGQHYDFARESHEISLISLQSPLMRHWLVSRYLTCVAHRTSCY